MNIGKFLNIGSKDEEPKKDDGQRDSSREKDEKKIDFEYSSDDSLKSVDILDDVDDKKVNVLAGLSASLSKSKTSNLANVSIQKKMTGFQGLLSRSITANISEREKRQKKRELKAKIHMGLNDLKKEQQKCLRNHINFIFLQSAFSVEDLHQRFKEFHNLFHQSF